MERSLHSPIERGVSLLGVLLATIGVYLPWVKVAPSHEGPIIAIHLWGMGTGFEPPSLALLVPALLVLFLVVWSQWSQSTAIAMSTIGIFYVVLPLYHAATVLETPFRSAPGAYLTGIGGLCMLFAGARSLLRTRGDATPTTGST